MQTGGDESERAEVRAPATLPHSHACKGCICHLPPACMGPGLRALTGSPGQTDRG